MGGDSLQQLLTDDDRRAHLHTLLAHRFKAHEQIQLPHLSNYNALGSDNGLRTTGHDICRQLGFKPSGLKIRYGEVSLKSGYQVDHTSKTILIDPRLKPHPYTAGAALALATTAFVLEHLSHQKPDKALVEFATIETGLGMWVVNALRPKIGLRQRIYHAIDSSWFHVEGLQLEAYSPRQYVERFVSYTHENHIATDTYLPYVLKSVRYLFPEFVQSQSERHLPEATVVIQHKRSANLLWAKIVLIALIAASGIILGVYALATRPQPINPEIGQKKQIAQELKKSYMTCLDEVSEQQSTYDPNDIFLTRQIDDTKTRCESLRNQYNYAVDQYEKSIK